MLSHLVASLPMHVVDALALPPHDDSCLCDTEEAEKLLEYFFMHFFGPFFWEEFATAMTTGLRGMEGEKKYLPP